MPRPDMRKQQIETEKKNKNTTGKSTQDDEANNVPPHVDDNNKKKNKSKNKKNKSNSMASIEMNQMNQANSTLVASSSMSNSTTATNSSSTSFSSSDTIFSKAIKGFTFFKQNKKVDSEENKDTENDNSKIDSNSNGKLIRGQTTPSQAPTIMIHNNKNNLQQQHQTIPNCTSSYISCYSQSHPAFTIAIINTVFLFLYYIFCSKRKYSRKWRPHNKTRDARGDYSAVQVYDTLLDDFDDGQLSVSCSVYDDGDDSSESIGSVISQWSDIGNTSRGGGRSKSGTRSVEMTIMGDDHLAMEEING